MIKRIICTCILMVICYILQTTFFWHIRLAGVVPNLLLILTVSAGYINGQKDGIICAMLCGLLSDMIFGSLIGLHALIFVIISFFSGYSHNIYLKNNFSVPLILIGVCDIAYGMLYYVFEFLLRGRLDFIFYFNNIILPEALYTVLVAILFYKLFVMSYRLTARPESREEF